MFVLVLVFVLVLLLVLVLVLVLVFVLVLVPVLVFVGLRVLGVLTKTAARTLAQTLCRGTLFAGLAVVA